MPDPLGPGQVHGPRRLGGLAVDPADAGQRVEVEREGHAQGDQGDLGGLPDAHPDDEERDQAEERQRAQHLHRRVDGVVADPAEAGDEGEHEPDGGADREAEADPLERHQDGRPEGAVLDQLDGPAEDLGGGGHRALVEDPGHAEQLPDDQDQQRARPSGAAGRRAGSPSSRAGSRGCGGGRCRQGGRGHGEESRELSQLKQVKHSTLDRRVSPVPGGGQSPGDLTIPAAACSTPASPATPARPTPRWPPRWRRTPRTRRRATPTRWRRWRGPGCWCRSSRCSARSRSTSAGWRTTRPATWRRCCSPAPTAGWRCWPSPAPTRCGAGTPRPGRCRSPAELAAQAARPGRRRGAGGRRGRPGDVVVEGEDLAGPGRRAGPWPGSAGAPPGFAPPRNDPLASRVDRSVPPCLPRRRRGGTDPTSGASSIVSHPHRPPRTGRRVRSRGYGLAGASRGRRSPGEAVPLWGRRVLTGFRL